MAGSDSLPSRLDPLVEKYGLREVCEASLVALGYPAVMITGGGKEIVEMIRFLEKGNQK